MLRQEFDSVIELVSSFKPDFKKNPVYVELLWKVFQDCEKNDFFQACESAISQKLSKELPTPTQIKTFLKKNLSTGAKKFATVASDANFFADYDRMQKRNGLKLVMGISSTQQFYSRHEKNPILGEFEWLDGDSERASKVIAARKREGLQ